MSKTLFITAGLLGLATSVQAGGQGFDAWTVQCGPDVNVSVALTGAPNDLYAVFTTPVGMPLTFDRNSRLHRGRFGPDGTDTFTLPVPHFSAFPDNHAVELHAVTRGTNGMQLRKVFLPLTGNGGTLCQDFDPDYTLGPVEPRLGEILTTQWDLVGMAISASNNNPLHPQLATIFDSANPTGGDTDLATPGYGPGNTEALGQLMIVPMNDLDLNGDGFIDEPNDERLGGVLRFDFADPYRVCSATLVDIDDLGTTELRFYIGANLDVETIPVPNLGDNSVQTLTFDKRDVRRFEVVLGGSGALANVGMVPCPMVVNLDETPFGAPLNLAAGSWITDQFTSLGLTIDAQNNNPTHPDKAILFDSANPTGDDFDLQTPGYGVNNTEALGMVLILAENDVDANGDGLVDDPDDERLGGQMAFDFAETVTFFSALILDVDGLERDVFTFFDENGATLDILEIDALGDNSVQMLTSPTPITGVKRIQANFTGSGAFARLRWCPDSNGPVL